MISTRDLSGLPGIDALKRLLQSMAMLDAILSPEWQFRYYSFNSKWAKGEQMGSMRDGCGNDLFALFNKHGCFLKGFHHEAEMSPYRETPPRLWPGLLDSAPKEFDRGLNEPAFMMGDTTFCIWRRYSDRRWRRGDFEFPQLRPHPDGAARDPDGSSQLLSPLDGKPATYLEWATGYYSLDEDDEDDEDGEGGGGRSLTIAHVRHVYAHKPLTAEMVKQINPEATLAELKGDVAEVGYPRRPRKK